MCLDNNRSGQRSFKVTGKLPELIYKLILDEAYDLI